MSDFDEFVRELSRPGARLLLHPDDVASLGPVAAERMNVPLDQITIVTNQWAQRGTMTVIPSDTYTLVWSRPTEEPK